MRPAGPGEVLHDPTAFAAILRVERMRSDRSGMAFTLAVFGCGQEEETPQRDRFAADLAACVRATDHVGWIDEQSIAVILWDTLPDGAWRFVEKVSGRAGWTPDDVQVYAYPTPPSDTESDLSEQTQEQTVPSNASCEHKSVQDSDGRATSNSRADAIPMELLFVQPLPRWKRLLDIFAAVSALLVLSPLLLAVAAVIKLTSPGPVLFKQQRSGRGGRLFTMYKFRSMVANAEQRKQELMQQNEQDGPAFKIENDPRITPIGHFIRKSSIDELPQLWNVLRGDMSIVGPRPLPCAETDGCESWQRRRLEVTPGLTCIWQVQDRRTKIPFADWARMDIRYIGSRTLGHDLRLIFGTVRSVLGRKGA